MAAIAAAAAAATRRFRVILFDVDGTLVKNSGSVHADAFAHAWRKIFGVTASIHDIQHHGSTDQLILRDVLAKHGVPGEEADAKMGAMCDAMCAYVDENADKIHLDPLPGVVPLLDALSAYAQPPSSSSAAAAACPPVPPAAAAACVALGLVTGNLERIAFAKLKAAGLDRYFTFGGFGSDHPIRSEMVKIAMEKAKTQLAPAGLQPSAFDAALKLPIGAAENGSSSDNTGGPDVLVYHCGDAPSDVCAASTVSKSFGPRVRGIGVSTGIFTTKELGAACTAAALPPPFAILDNMEDLSHCLRLFGLPPKLTFYTAWFCPYAQRAWIALEHSGVRYESVEALTFNPDQTYKKSPRLLACNPNGLVPTITRNNHGHDGKEEGNEKQKKSNVVYESLVCVEFIQDLVPATSSTLQLLPTDPWQKANSRMFAAWINANVCSPFYTVLVRKDKTERLDAFARILNGLRRFSAECDSEGPCFTGSSLGLVDIALFPWAFRMYILEHFRGPQFKVPSSNEDPSLARYHQWYEHVSALPAVQTTIANKTELLRVYERYADGSAHSKVADAVRSGKAAHEHS